MRTSNAFEDHTDGRLIVRWNHTLDGRSTISILLLKLYDEFFGVVSQILRMSSKTNHIRSNPANYGAKI